MADATEPTRVAPDGSELRGTFLRVWVAGGSPRFEPQPETDTVYTIHVPIGWSFRPDAGHGVVLVNVFGERLSAFEAVYEATDRVRGFRVVRLEIIRDEPV